MRIYLVLAYTFLLFSSPGLWAQEDEEENLEPRDSTPILRDSKQQAAVDGDEAILNLGMKNFDNRPRDGRGIRLCFYNVENLFDIEDDPKTRDDDFTPKGNYGWTYSRYKQKLNNIYKTMSAVGGWGGPPEVIGFCEIENRRVLQDLIKLTPLQKYNYDIAHEDSPDRRGIDVGLIYRKDKFQLIGYETINVTFPFDTAGRTRDVLHVWGRIMGKDTLHVFVNHWPSRRGGQATSEPRRTYVASLVRAKIDSIYKAKPDANIVVIGDFNDEAENKSLTEVLRAKHDMEHLDDTDMYNYMHALSKNWKMGSHKFQGHWGTLDHIIVSAPLIKNKKQGRLHASPAGGQIFAARFLLEDDNRYLGLQPFRTYGGPKYLGGFSDHLPVYIDLLYSLD